MDEQKDVSRMTFQERYNHNKKQHEDHQVSAKAVTPHDLRVKEREDKAKEISNG